MDFARIVQIYLIQGGFTFFFLYMAYIVLKRGKKPLHLYLTSFYLSTTAGGILNIIYANIFEATLVYIMHFLTYFLFCFSLVFLLIFTLIIIKPAKIITFKFQILILILFGILILGLLLFPSGIIIDETTNWKPEWSWSFFIYSIIVCTSIAILPTLYYSIRIYIKFESGYLKKKWKFFLIGISAYFFLFYGTSLSNTIGNDSFRFIWSLLSLPTLISLYLIYHGVGRQLE